MAQVDSWLAQVIYISFLDAYNRIVLEVFSCSYFLSSCLIQMHINFATNISGLPAGFAEEV